MIASLSRSPLCEHCVFAGKRAAKPCVPGNRRGRSCPFRRDAPRRAGAHDVAESRSAVLRIRDPCRLRRHSSVVDARAADSALRRRAAVSTLGGRAVWLVGIGGLFGYHALYFAALRRAPPADASLIAYLWPLLIVLFSASCPASGCVHATFWGRLSDSPARRRCSCQRAPISPPPAGRRGPAMRWRSAALSSGRAIRCCRAA